MGKRKVEGNAYREFETSMLVEVADAAVHDGSNCSGILCATAHETSEDGVDRPWGSRDEDNRS
jgi:hypothetical protein